MSSENLNLLHGLEGTLGDGDFDAALRIIESQELTSAQGRYIDLEDERIGLRAFSMAAEVLDYFGRYEVAAALIGDEGARCYRLLRACDRSRSSVSGVERSVLKQRVFMTLRFGYVYYRSGDYRKALSVFKLCLRVCENVIAAGSNRPYGTIARAYHAIASAFRQLHDYESAQEYFTESLRYTWLAGQNYLARSTGSGRGQPLSAMNDYHVANAMAEGIAYIHRIQGRPELALPPLIAAQQLLARGQEKILKAYVDVLYAALRRSTAGNQPEELKQLISILQNARTIFIGQHGHRVYQLRTEYQLALVYLEQARRLSTPSVERENVFAATSQCLQDVQQLAREIDDTVHEALALILESRLSRFKGDAPNAEEMANKALSLAYESSFLRVQALIARGEARYARSDLSGSIEDFEAALRSGGRNAPVGAACHLHLARTCLRLGELKSSRKHFEAWKVLKTKITNTFLNWLEEQVQREYAGTGVSLEDFVVRKTENSLHPEDLERKLHGFLVDWAQERTDNDEQAADLLGISRQTLYNWRARPARGSG